MRVPGREAGRRHPPISRRTGDARRRGGGHGAALLTPFPPAASASVSCNNNPCARQMQQAWDSEGAAIACQRVFSLNYVLLSEIWGCAPQLHF